VLACTGVVCQVEEEPLVEGDVVGALYVVGVGVLGGREALVGVRPAVGLALDREDVWAGAEARGTE
jgi:hypothetical protein